MRLIVQREGKKAKYAKFKTRAPRGKKLFSLNDAISLNQFQICRKVTTLSCKGCSRNSIGKCDVYGVSGKRGKKERKFILGPIRARNTTGRNECCFHRRTIRAEFQGSLNKSLDRAIIIENRGRGCCSNNEPLGENGQTRTEERLHSLFHGLPPQNSILNPLELGKKSASNSIDPREFIREFTSSRHRVFRPVDTGSRFTKPVKSAERDPRGVRDEKADVHQRWVHPSPRAKKSAGHAFAVR